MVEHAVVRAGRVLHEVVEHALRAVAVEFVAGERIGAQADLAVCGRVRHGDVLVDDGEAAVLLLAQDGVVGHGDPDLVVPQF